MQSIQNKLALKRIETDAERQAYCDIRAVLRPDRKTNLEEMRKEDDSMPKDIFFERYLLLQDNEPIAAGGLMQVFWNPDPTLFDMWLALPGDLSPEASEFALKEGEQILKANGAKKVNSWVATRFPNMVAAHEAAGYTYDQSNPESILHLAEMDLSGFQPAIDSLYASGLRVFSLADLLEEDPENGFARYHELDIRLTKDVPLPYEFTGEPLESFEKGFRTSEHSFPTIQIAADGDYLVATSMLFKNKLDPRYYGTGLTGVDREYRRRGIAKALKAINFNLAKQAGGEVILCDNEENNPMLQLNYQLGFKPHWVWNSYTKVL